MGIKREEEEPFSAPPWIVTFSDMIGLLTSFFIMLLTYSTKSKADFQKLAGALKGEFGLIADPNDSDFQSIIPPKDLLNHKFKKDGLKQERPELEKPKDQGKVVVRKPATGERVQLEKMSDGMRIKLVTQTRFAPGSTRLTESDQETLREVGDLLRLTKHRFIVVGNAWNEGDAARTVGDLVSLSQQRALEVALYLESIAHIDRDRIGVGGVGASQPLEVSLAPEIAEQNRRVEIILFPGRVSAMALKKHKEEKFIVPGWMVSFSDMIVNMMCFFILLNSMATTQECGFVGAGTGEYVQSVGAEGHPGLMPAQTTLIQKSNPQPRYEAPHLKPLSGKEWVEHTLRTLQEEFDRISKSHPDLSDPGRQFKIPVELLFRSGSSRLGVRQKQELDLALMSLQWRKDRIEIVGACSPDEVGTMRDALELSFARARAVADYLSSRGMPTERLVPSGIGDAGFGGASDDRRDQRRRVELRWMLKS